MKSTLIAVILALACAYGLYSQYNGKQKQIADAESRARVANDEVAGLRPRLEKSRAHFEARKKTLDETTATMPQQELEASMKAGAVKLEETKAELAAEQAKPVPDPPLPAPAAAEIDAANKRLATLKEDLAKLEQQNVILRRYQKAEAEVAPKPKPRQPGQTRQTK